MCLSLPNTKVAEKSGSQCTSAIDSPLRTGSHGKAIAAFLSDKELDALLQHEEVYFHGDPSKFDRDKLNEEMSRCRREWFAEDLEETVPGLNVVAALLLGPNGRPIGYMVALGLASAEAARQCGPLVAEAGKTLSRLLGAEIEG